MGTVRLLSQLRGPLVGLAAALFALAQGADYLLSTCILLFVGVLAWVTGLRRDVADLRAEGYGNFPIGGWIAGGDMGGGGGI